MLLQTEGDLIVLLALAAAILLGLALMAGIVAVKRTLQVREFQSLLFKAERKIDNLERRMFNVLNAIPVALMETDATGKFTFANRTAHQLLGRKDNELIGLRFHSATWGITYPDGRIIPPDLLPVARTLRGQTVKGFEHMIVNHNTRSKVRVSVTSMPIVNTMGEVIGSTTALVELETTYGEGIGDLSGIWRGHWFTSAPAAFFGLDQNGTIVDLNAAACDLFGLTRETALGRSWGEFCIAADDLPKALDYLTGLTPDSAGIDDNRRHITLSLKAPDNQTRTGIVSGWRVHTQDGAEQGITVMALPLPSFQIAHTSAVSPEDALALADLRQAETARAALGVGVWYYDRDSEAIIEDEGMRRLIGRTEAGGPTLISDTDQALADTAFGQLMSGEADDLDLELEVNHPEQGLRKIALKGQAHGPEDLRQLFGVAIDITDHVEAAKDSAPQPPPKTLSETANENQRYTEGMEYLSLKTRLGALEHEVHTLKLAKADLEARERRLDQALNETSRYEAAGRLSGQMAHDFSEMLKVMNAALEMIGKQSPNSDLKRLSDAALAAGRRGERLTRQLQGLIPPADPSV